MNQLYYGDNLSILREYIPDASVDLIYLDPPFNSNRNYNVLFKTEAGDQSAAQLTAFEDTWHWDINTEAIYRELITAPRVPAAVSAMITALRDFIGSNQMMAYLTNMTIRLVELHRVLKPTGSLYLHCDPTASHYLKIVLDAIFGFENFRNEIVWKRTNAKSLAFTNFAKDHDVIFRYTKSNSWVWNQVYIPHDPEYVKKFYRHVDIESGRVYQLADLTNPNKDRPNLTYEFLGVTRVWRWTKERMQKAFNDGLIYQHTPDSIPRLKRYLDEQMGNPIDDTWVDIGPLQAADAEKLGYPTQKPQALLERIIAASSNPGDLVLDPFCGCGTAVAAAQALGRRWIGIDITHLAVALIKYRIQDSFPDARFEILGEPQSLEDARYLAENDRHQFEWWALSLVRARPSGGDGGKIGKKGADRGIDGIINFIDGKNITRQIIIQVKSGHVNAAAIRDLIGTVNNNKAALGILLTLEEPTRPMHEAAAQAGFFHSDLWHQDFPVIQILTIQDLLHGKTISMPAASAHTTFTKAPRQNKDDSSKQPDLFG